MELTSEQTNDGERRLRLRQAALAWAALGILVVLISFFAESEVRSRPAQAAELSLGTLFIVLTSILLNLDLRIRGVEVSIWLARLLIVPGAWAMLSFIGQALYPDVQQPLPGLGQAAASMKAALAIVIMVMLLRAGFGHSRSPKQDQG